MTMTTTDSRIGSFPHAGLSTFRVWAPFAREVQLKYWKTPEGTPIITPLRVDPGHLGCWSGNVPGVTEGMQYVYLIHSSCDSSGNVTQTPSEQVHLERIDPRSRCVYYPNWDTNHSDANPRSVVIQTDYNKWSKKPYQTPGWHEMVIYQLHVATFLDNRKHKPGDSAASKLNLLGKQLDHLTELGVNAVQFLPFSEFWSELSMGYNTVLPYAVERDYGSPEDLKELVNALHDRGLAVIFDVVYNHFADSNGGSILPYSLNRFDGWGPGQNTCGVYFYGGNELSTPWGPRPDYGREEVREYLRDNALMWLEEYRMDGLRFDSTKCIRKRQGCSQTSCEGIDIGMGRNYGWELMQEINQEIDKNQSWKLTIAEDLDNNKYLVESPANGGAGFDAQWDTTLGDAIRDAVTQPNDNTIDIGKIAWTMLNALSGDPFKRVIYVESHDQADKKRLPDLIAPGNADGWHARKKSMLAAGVLLASPGIPMLFQGTEFLCWEKWSDSNPINWSFKDKFRKNFQFYRDLIRLRRNLDGHSGGLSGPSTLIIEANAQNKVLVFHRWNEGAGQDDVVVIANFSGATYDSYRIGLPYPGLWYVRLNSDAKAYDDQFGAVHCYNVVTDPIPWSGMPCSGNMAIGPYSIVMLSR